MYTHPHTHARTRARTLARTHARTHARAHTHKHTHTHTHTDSHELAMAVITRCMRAAKSATSSVAAAEHSTPEALRDQHFRLPGQVVQASFAI